MTLLPRAYRELELIKRWPDSPLKGLRWLRPVSFYKSRDKLSSELSSIIRI